VRGTPVMLAGEILDVTPGRSLRHTPW